ncbi:Rrf2 family transcriptional regulator [Caenimonas koreensis DSM 17982]|uniref:Rrf2 family transcriptional regulator n=1 Tax=Caenimonas koreensis DSM 17982 TaxID=1121255 RepID=A0A844BBQ3_9BURK|nr:Rrf2 family transcriptional regulator [Caenimonas koreensis]MRD48996.1 Rrf2 family transcriptional regulator [Caenimonas koreensis DSM 17982]
MRLTAFTDYSLRVLMYLATRPQEQATISAIATAFDIKENHLTKVVHFLGKEGWITTTRGKGGGMRLARDASAIVVGEVVRSTEGDAMPAECFALEGGNCCITPICMLSGALQEAVDAFYLVLDSYTLEEVVSNRDQIAQLLFVRSKELRAPH